MICGHYFITPHAVKQFKARIAKWLTYEQALAEIIKELRGVKKIHPTMNGKAYYVRTDGKWRFRAVISNKIGKDLESSGKPVVVTILRSGRSRKKKTV
ncbi:MAG: hypothetical protein GXY77_11315 [Fibrobacter sp.]|nr:hypothetical protein [Fibrobacter sp.]